MSLDYTTQIQRHASAVGGHLLRVLNYRECLVLGGNQVVAMLTHGSISNRQLKTPGDQSSTHPHTAAEWTCCPHRADFLGLCAMAVGETGFQPVSLTQVLGRLTACSDLYPLTPLNTRIQKVGTEHLSVSWTPPRLVGVVTGKRIWLPLQATSPPWGQGGSDTSAAPGGVPCTRITGIPPGTWTKVYTTADPQRRRYPHTLQEAGQVTQLMALSLATLEGTQVLLQPF